MSNTSLAIDIVLLPPPEISQEAVNFSAYLNDKYGEKIRLNLNDRLPHISLLMGVLQEDNREKVQKILQDISTLLPLELEITGVQSNETTGLVIMKTAAIERLQQVLIEQVSPLLIYDVKPDMFNEEVNDRTLLWVANYLTHAQDGHFNPHITVGPASEGEKYSGPTSFVAITLALCRLGNWCTCREVICSVDQ